MGKKIFIILPFLIQQFAFGQSPFDYGQNKKVYFITSELRNKLDIKTIYTIDQRFENDRGGMHQNWDVTAISFDTDIITEDWSPISMDSTYKYRFDSLTNNLQFLNGTRYEFSNNQLVSWGGGGYGSFDWMDIMRYTDTVSIITTSCVGHCGNQPSTYSKNVFNKHGQLSYIIFYPTPNEEDFDTENDTIALTECDTITLDCGIEFLTNKGNSNDTLFYFYDITGLYLGDSKQNKIDNFEQVKKLFSYLNFPSLKFHQCYIGDVEMEKYFITKLGFTPELILFEIYEHGVFSFTLNNADKKYYQTKSIVLEK